MLTQHLEQFRTKQHIPVLASLAALDVNHHALAVDVADFQVRQFRAPHAGGVERHQQSAMARRACRVDQSRDFFLAENGWQVKCPLRIGRLRDAPGLLERLAVEEPQSRQTLRNGARRQLPLLKQLGLIFTNVPGAQTVRRTVESSSKFFDCADVTACGSLGVITTLEFLQHHFSQMAHRDLLVTQTYLSRKPTTVSPDSRVASAAGRLRSGRVLGN